MAPEPRPSSPVWAEEERRERGAEGAEASRGRFVPLRRDGAARSGSPGAEPAAPGPPKKQLRARSERPHSPSAWSREFMAGGRAERRAPGGAPSTGR